MTSIQTIRQMSREDKARYLGVSVGAYDKIHAAAMKIWQPKAVAAPDAKRRAVGAGLRLARAKLPVGTGVRPPSFMSRKELAWELSVSESTIDEFVRRGIIPPPILLSAGCVRWSWPAVQERLAAAGTVDDGDSYMAGASNAAA